MKISDGFIISKALEYIKRSMPYGLNVILDRIFSQGPAILLMWFSGAKAVGLFQAAFKVATTLQLLKNPLVGTFFPRISSAIFKDVENSHLIFKIFCRYSILVGLIVTFPFIFFSERVIGLLYSHQYEDSSSILLFLSIGVLFRYMATAPMSLLSAREDQWPVTFSTFISSLIFCISAIILAKIYASQGIAIAWLLGSISLFILFVRLSSKKGYLFGIKQNIFKLLPIFGVLFFVAITFESFYSARGSDFIFLKIEVAMGLIFIFIISLFLGYLTLTDIKKTAYELKKMFV